MNWNDRSRPFFAVDAVIFYGSKFDDEPKLVLIERGHKPLGLAFPGGHVEYGESLEQAVIREVKEETGLDLHIYEQFFTYSKPDRDPRSHTISTVFIGRVTSDQVPLAGDDAAKVRIIPVKEALEMDFAFDHKEILEDAIKYAVYNEGRRRKEA